MGRKRNGREVKGTEKELKGGQGRRGDGGARNHRKNNVDQISKFWGLPVSTPFADQGQIWRAIHPYTNGLRLKPHAVRYPVH